MKRIFIGLALLLMASVGHAKQHQLSIDSAALAKTISVNVITPSGYDSQPQQRFPVIYLLDGQQHQDHTVSNAAFLNRTNVMPKIIVVAIGQVDRFRYFTPTKDPQDRWQSGQSQQYIQFLKQELMPQLRSRFRTSGFDMIAGHSLGGLLVAELLQQQPQLFDGFYLFSPSLWWHNEYPLTQLLAQESPAQGSPFVFISLANEQGQQRQAFDNYLPNLQRQFPNLISQQFPQEDHMTTPLVAQVAAFRQQFADWLLPFEQVVADPQEFVGHYQRLNQKYGTNVEGQQWEISQPLNHLINELQDSEKAQRGAEVYLTAFPSSPWAHKAQADAYALAGQSAKAYASMAQAVRLAKAQNDSYLATFEAALASLEAPQQ